MGLTDWTELKAHSQRVFVEIETILDRYNCLEMSIVKEDLAYDCMMSKASIRTALAELKSTGYIITKNENSPIMRIGDPYKYGGVSIMEEKE